MSVWLIIIASTPLPYMTFFLVFGCQARLPFDLITYGTGNQIELPISKYTVQYYTGIPLSIFHHHWMPSPTVHRLILVLANHFLHQIILWCKYPFLYISTPSLMATSPYPFHYMLVFPQAHSLIFRIMIWAAVLLLYCHKSQMLVCHSQ